MAVDEVLMQDVTAEINTGTIGVPVWTAIARITDISHAPTKTTVDTKNYDSAGRHEHKVVRRGDSFTITAQRAEDPDDGSRDAGQEAVETAGQAIGDNAEKQYRLTSPGGNTLTFLATAQVTELGGGTDAISTWQAVLEVTGSVTRG